MTLSWNEIKDRAVRFSKEWGDTSNEDADANPFLVEFFNELIFFSIAIYLDHIIILNSRSSLI